MGIQRLPEEMIGRIAAGEVIERPAAAVKELIENALDAGATAIDVAISEGGVAFIDVRDDGAGMSDKDLLLAVERHATSKITSIDDLMSLKTLGFRGEALASMAAVSDLTIRTLDGASGEGWSRRVKFGVGGPVERIAWASGAAISARNLFENVPARRKFLRQPQTEASYVTRVVSAYALAYPGVAFTLEIDGRRTMTTDGRGDQIAAAVGVWGDEVAAALVPLRTPDDMPEGYDVGGLVSLPHLDRATRQTQHLFAQGRLVASRQLGTAFEQAYQTLLMVGRHPVGCIRLTVPPDRIDVNVHPTKAEVRFADERLVFSLVQRAVREAIVAMAPPPAVPTVVASPLSDWAVQRRFALAHPDRHPSPASLTDTLSSGTSESLAPEPAAEHRLPVLRVLGQIASTFIIAEGPDGMYMIDQHAAHERIMYERLMADYVARSPDRQLLLEPATVDLAAPAWEMYRSCRDDLVALGFDLEEFGGTAILVRAVPAKLRVRHPARMIETILEELVAGGRGESRLESLAISAACHASIRANQPLSLLEMRELVVQLERCSSPLACGHGRPTMLRMTSEELEKQFSRR
ncbi:MAG TPA: DNA mismatch repair endonuclease MutL [Thermomicrobiales bacterium]|nr:DNA mismatch repair endonuclease MutL [Chloroflexota bacterium]HCG29878.1 DNA mismatch repair endonuclease MutL [Chloroflexota bacterium]HQX61902.1 DNA mismatch repair endonuclease MutL [Thermomicrobiales bacterium]HQZ88705.1 DNA mismatch repair endonuclease MutL [Thermomicrobiales bacterium]HRA31755.1 DNA mismatch repair endonuclease MutL [Thermomicrobiales bacterium]